MNRKGFTLVELLALIGLLTIVVLIATPNIINQIESQKSKNYENFVSDLCLSTEAYINHGENIEGIDDFNDPGDAIEISMNDLIVNGYVKSSTKNPRTKETVKTTDHIIVTINQDKTYSCELNGVMPEQIVYEIDNASQLIYSNTKTGLACNNVQCALDKIAEMLE